jgi:dTDP-4-amino-4,6-dideoxygalactose transaminase
MKWQVPLSDLDFSNEEKEAVQHVLDSGWLTMGEITQQFEQEFARMVGVPHAIAVTNGTASLHLACRALGLGPGDEVIVPSLTFVATANAILYVGATPVFADISSEDNLNISPESIEQRITSQTRAIMVMHYGGYPCDMPAILEIARRHHLYVIEDAAHAPGAAIKDRKMGAWGHIASFSFFPNKNMTTGEGGMLTTSDEALAEKMRLLRSHGMTTLTWDRHQGHAWSYDVVDLGYNYRIDEIRSAIGREQLKKLEKNNHRRRELTALYRQLFHERLPEISTPFDNYPWQASAHIFPILLPKGVNRTQFAEAMKDHLIQTSLHYPPIHLFRYYRENELVPDQPLPLTENVAAREVTLPLYGTLEPAAIEMVVDAVRDAVSQAQQQTPRAPIPTSQTVK